jgi:hypothetical protein
MGLVGETCAYLDFLKSGRVEPSAEGGIRCHRRFFHNANDIEVFMIVYSRLFPLSNLQGLPPEEFSSRPMPQDCPISHVNGELYRVWIQPRYISMGYDLGRFWITYPVDMIWVGFG